MYEGMRVFFRTCARIYFIALGVATTTVTLAQHPEAMDSTSVYQMSLEELTNLKATGISSELESLVNSLIGVASKKPLSARKTPSIVTVVTEEEIRRSGARDLIDVLRLVPGFDFGVDVQGVIGLGIRGNWAHEGKVLLLLDGQEMNETLFSTLQLGNNYNIDQIKRIEIIRGPGSASYGGYAEYGVIHIITKSAEDLQGITASATYGQLSRTYGRRNVNLSGGALTDDWALSVSTFLGQGNRSNQDYVDLEGNTYNMAGNSDLNPMNLNVGMRYKNFSFRGIADSYKTTHRDSYGSVNSLMANNFTSYYAEAKYTATLSNTLTLTPRFNFKRQTPWQSPPLFEGSLPYHIVADRYRGNLTLAYNPSNRISLTNGGEFFIDHAVSKVDSLIFINEQHRISYRNLAFFAESLIKHRLVNVILGGRFDNNDAFGSAFVPRAGLTRKFGKANLKLLYSNSFRAPGIENINYRVTDEMLPEMTQVLEWEAGYQLSPVMFVSANVFDITTRNPIVYMVDEVTNEEGYMNFERTGSRGAEVEFRLRNRRGYLNASYAFYSAAGKNRVDSYEVTGRPNVLLAFPTHKWTFNGSISLGKNLSINPSGSLLGKRYGYAYDPETAGAELREFRPVFLVNTFLQYEQPGRKPLHVGLGVYDMLNQRFSFIQPYNSGHAPLPGPGREIILKISYHLPLHVN